MASIFSDQLSFLAMSSRFADQPAAHAKNITIQGLSLYFRVVLHTYSIFRIFTMSLLFQIEAHQKEDIKSREGVLKDLLTSQDKDTMQLLKEAAE